MFRNFKKQVLTSGLERRRKRMDTIVTNPLYMSIISIKGTQHKITQKQENKKQHKR